MNKSLFRYIWRHSRRDQLIIFMVVLASLPFYYVSLDLPRRIVNEAIQGHAFEAGQITAPFLSLHLPGWLGGGEAPTFPGFQLGRVQLLFGLSFLFLFFVLVNGWFKYWINVAKGALGERMLRRMRFELFAMALRFTPETLRTVKSSEAATIIKDEVEPIGGFIGDAFIQPVFLGTQAATALIFILMQNVWLGLIAAGIVGIQFIIIPRMRRELLRLGRKRQIASRRLAGRIGEVVDGLQVVHVHGTGRWERAEIGNRLYELFDIRFRIFKRKFIVKFINNLLAQMTPFFFYAFGGYFALQGRLDIGQLVAVIAAYRELPPPLKELIDWDQQRLDVQVKYDQVVMYFSAEKLLAMPGTAEDADEAVDFAQPLAGMGITVLDSYGTALLDDASFTVQLPVAAVLTGGAGAAVLARVVAQREPDYVGAVTVGGTDLAHLDRATVARHVAYSGPEPILFPGTLRENLLYGLRCRPNDSEEEEADAAERLRIQEAKRTGNPTERTDGDWTDLGRTGAADEDALDERLLGLLDRVGLDADIYRFGLGGLIDPERHKVLAEQLIEARERFRQRLEELGLSELVDPFDPERYNEHATIAENLLFGVPVSRALTGRSLPAHPGFREALERSHLTVALAGMGRKIADTMVDIFRGLPPNHILFDQFSFVHADELADFEAIVKRAGVEGRGGLTRDDWERLLSLPFGYIEPRHRLGLLDDDLRARIVAARPVVSRMLTRDGQAVVAPYKADEVNLAAPVRDNLLFGKVNETVAGANERVREIAREVIGEFELRDDIQRVGLDHQVGPEGRLLSSAQRASVDLIRCLVRRPDVLVVDGALAALPDDRVGPVIDMLREDTAGRTLFLVAPGTRVPEGFDVTLTVTGGRVATDAASGAAVAQAAE